MIDTHKCLCPTSWSRNTPYTWIGRHREGGAAAMNDRGRDSNYSSAANLGQ